MKLSKTSYDEVVLLCSKAPRSGSTSLKGALHDNTLRVNQKDDGVFDCLFYGDFTAAMKFKLDCKLRMIDSDTSVLENEWKDNPDIGFLCAAAIAGSMDLSALKDFVVEGDETQLITKLSPAPASDSIPAPTSEFGDFVRAAKDTVDRYVNLYGEDCVKRYYPDIWKMNSYLKPKNPMKTVKLS